MAQRGLLHPVVVTPDYTLVAGARRIEAARLLGWLEIPVTIIDIEDLLSAERDENAERKDLTPTEAVAIGKFIEEIHRARIAAQVSAIHRQNRVGRDKGKKEAVVEPEGKTDVVVGKVVGMSEPTYFRAKKVVAAGKADPAQFGDLPGQMDETGNVSGTYRELRRRQGTPGAGVPHPVPHLPHGMGRESRGRTGRAPRGSARQMGDSGRERDEAGRPVSHS